MTAAERRAWIRNYHRRNRAERRAAGLCYKCGERPPEGRWKTCKQCRVVDAHYRRERVAGRGELMLQQAEKDFRQAVLDYAKLSGWTCWWTWNSKHSPPGELDLRMCRPPRYVVAELKRQDGKLTDKQAEAVTLLRECPGVEVYVWRPSSWPQIEDVLRRNGR